jgi:hypothetical protein
MAVILQEAGAEVQRRRLLRIMKQRQEAHARGSEAQHTTHLWSQHHLRRAGVALPEVQWPGQEGKGGKQSKGGARSSQWWSSSPGWWGGASSGSWWGSSSSSGWRW